MSQSENESQADEDKKQLDFADTVRIDTGKDALWDIISDPEVLTQCVPGAESIERVSERKYTCEITRGVSHMTVSLSGEAEFVEMNPPDYIVTTANAFDSKTGSNFDMLAAMEMNEVDDEEAVDLTYTAEVKYTGGVASLSKRILRPIVSRDVNTYFENIKDTVENSERA